MKKIVMAMIVMFLPIFSSINLISVSSPNVSATSAVVINMDTNEILFEKNPHEPLKIASITKIMTAIVAIEYGEMKDQVKISHNAAHKEGSSIYTKPGDVYTLEELVYGLMLRSGNDAATAIAEHIAGSEKGFAYLMNEKARWIGMTNSSFQNPHGLDEERHYSTAFDMALLTSYAMNTSKVFKKVFGTKKYLSDQVGYHWFNKNKMLMTNDFCTGGKTGFTKSAGRTLVTTAEHNGHQIVVVTINAPNDWNDHRKLYDYAFEILSENEEESIEPLNFTSFIRSYFDVLHHLNGVEEWSI